MKTELFVFQWLRNGVPVKLEEHIVIPNCCTPAEEASILCRKNCIPSYVKEDLFSAVKAFIHAKTEEYYDSTATECSESVADTLRAELAAKQWGSKEPAARESVDGRDEDLFCECYECLLHCHLDTINLLLQFEKRSALEVQSIISHRDHEVSLLKEQHADLMDSATNGHYSEAEVNQKAIRLFEHIHTLESEHASKLTSIAETQRREYRYYLGDLHEKHLLGKLKVDPSPERHRAGSTADGQPLDSKGFEESFTIHLGAQMKTMHNVRLAVANPLDLCFSAAKIDEISQKLHMSLNLYTDRLSAVVLFVDSKPTYHIDFRTDFYRACERSTELHFQNLESQLLQIKHDCINANKWRQQQASTSSNSPGQGSSVYERSYDSDDTLKTGDVYITRHSNLSSVNVVFHMVSDDETLRTQEINSRHPCLNALRNIIRICMRFGITTINLPLLLVNEFTQEMNVSWCAKRAELVFKCVKGFMIEGGNLKSNTQYNVQFLLPLGTPANIFWHMSEMLPTIFRLANPVVMASTTQAR